MAHPHRFSHSGTSATLPALAGAALLVLLVAQAGNIAAPGQGATTLFVPASGVALALVLRGGLALLPGVGIGWLLAYALAGEALLHALAHTLGQMAAVGVAGHWLRRRAPFDSDQPSFDMFKQLLLGACLVGAGVGALVASAGHALLHGAFEGGVALHLAQAWMGPALGFLLATPLALACHRALHQPMALARLREGVLLWLLAAIAAAIIFGPAPAPWLAPLANAYWMFLFVGWSGMRLGLAPTVALLNLVALMALWGVYQRTGFFARDIAATWGFGYWSYLMILGVLGLALSSYMADQQAQEGRCRAAERAQRDALVREVHHRIKNNLQGIVGMLRRLDRQHPQLHEAINQMVSQVHGIAVVHGLQGRSAGESIVLAELVQAVAQGMSQAWATPVRLQSAPHCLPWRVAASEAVPVALVLGELMRNAVKHGGQAAQDVQLHCSCDAQAQHARITVSNPGHWAPDAARDALPAGHGLDLVRLLLPRQGARLTHDALDGRVIARLDLFHPVICVDNAPHGH